MCLCLYLCVCVNWKSRVYREGAKGCQSGSDPLTITLGPCAVERPIRAIAVEGALSVDTHRRGHAVVGVQLTLVDILRVAS